MRAVIQANGTLGPVTWGSPGLGIGGRRRRRRRPTTSSPACRRRKPRPGSAELLAAVGRPARRAAADHPPREVLREGRSPARDRHQPAVVHQDHRAPRRAAGSRPRDAVAPRVHAGALRELGQRTERRLVHQPAALLRRAVPGVVPVREDGSIDYQARLVPDEARLPIDPSTDVPDGFTEADRGRPGGFIGDPDVMDTWATSSISPQLVTGWERDPDLLRPHVPDGPAAAGPRHHPHLAVLVGAARSPRERLAAVAPRGDLGLGARPRPQEDVEVEGQRRHAAGAAAGVRLRRRALLGGARRPRRGHRLRHRPDEDRPAPGHQAAERVEVRPRPRRGDRCRSPTRSIARC